jgi:hypothetical protein
MEMGREMEIESKMEIRRDSRSTSVLCNCRRSISGSGERTSKNMVTMRLSMREASISLYFMLVAIICLYRTCVW